MSVRLGDNLQNPIAGNPPGSTYDSATRTITWTYGDMAPNGWRTFYVEATVNPTLAAGFIMHANWTVKATGMLDTTADQAITVDQARPAPSVSVEHVLAPNTIAPGSSAPWSATVRQNSPYDLHNFKLTFKAPTSLTFSDLATNCSRHATNNWVICTLDGTAGSRQTKSVTVEAPAGTPMQAWHLTIHGIEITQSIQDYPSNSVRLLEYRKTWIRVYPVSSAGTVQNVDCVLRVYRCTGDNCTQLIATLPPLADPLGKTTRSVGETYDRADGAQGFIFGLPHTEAHNTLRFAAEINTSRSVVETNYTNNSLYVGPFTFQRSFQYAVAFVNGGYRNATGGYTYAGPAGRATALAYLRGSLPVTTWLEKRGQPRQRGAPRQPRHGQCRRLERRPG